MHPMISGDVDCSNDSHFLQLLCTENASSVLFASTEVNVIVDLRKIVMIYHLHTAI